MELLNLESGYRRFRGAVAVACLLAAGPTVAWAANGCLTTEDGTYCVSLESLPGASVQPSGAGGGDTYIRYTANVTQVSGDLDHDLLLGFSFSTPVTLVEFSQPADGRCYLDVSGDLACRWDGDGGGGKHGDKHDGDNHQGDKKDKDDVQTTLPSQSLTLVVRAPDWLGPVLTPPTLTNRALLAMDGDSQAVSHTVALDARSGETWCPANTQCTVATAPVAATEAQQTTAVEPRYGKLTLTSGAFGFPIDLDFISNGLDRSLVCPAPSYVYFDPMADGGPFLCRDNQNPRRWLEVYAGEYRHNDPDFRNFFEPVLELRLIWDATLVSPLQLDLEQYPFAVFYYGTDTAGQPEQPIRAFSRRCGTNPVYPCITDIQQLASGDWAVTFKSRRIEDLQGGYISTAPTPKPPIGNF